MGVYAEIIILKICSKMLRVHFGQVSQDADRHTTQRQICRDSVYPDIRWIFDLVMVRDLNESIQGDALYRIHIQVDYSQVNYEFEIKAVYLVDQCDATDQPSLSREINGFLPKLLYRKQDLNSLWISSRSYFDPSKSDSENEQAAPEPGPDRKQQVEEKEQDQTVTLEDPGERVTEMLLATAGDMMRRDEPVVAPARSLIKTLCFAASSGSYVDIEIDRVAIMVGANEIRQRARSGIV